MLGIRSVQLPGFSEVIESGLARIGREFKIRIPPWESFLLDTFFPYFDEDP
jgi:hypothetical protein